MFEGLSDTALLRIGIAVAAAVLFAIILLTSRRKKDQGKRTPAPRTGSDRRQEPTLSEILEAEAHEPASVEQPDLGLGDPKDPPGMQVGSRPSHEFDKIVTLYIAARAGHTLNGPDLVVAAEKAGLIYGHMNIFHRMMDKHPEHGPIFSVANLVQPGHFDLRTIKDLKTPGISFFMTLPGPLAALDAWDTMLPTAQRMAELLDAVLLDEERNALGRQRIANIRDELRAYDRAREKLTIKPGR
ncbi:cell division protein ZipA [Arenimonas sp.]|uniref:cell division protein ZipA n=1 Tax=Arenimonas sp. TaxID=1872635 RepID=UPI0039E280B2